MPFTMADDGPARPRLAERAKETLGMTDGFGSALFFALQAAGCALAALWIAMAIQLDEPYWAASTVLITAQATRSQSLQKAVNRIVGTLIGLVGSVLVVALFPQHWWSFALGLSGWIAICTFVACVLRALQAYAAALAGFTALIILSQSFGDPNGTFMTALNRGSSVVIGVSLYVVVTILLTPPRSTQALIDRFETFLAKTHETAVRILRGQAGSAEGVDLLIQQTDFDEAIDQASTDGYWAPGTMAEMRRATLAATDVLMLASEAAKDRNADAEKIAAALESTRGIHPDDASIARLQDDTRECRRLDAASAPWILSAIVNAMAEARAGQELLRTQRVPPILGEVRRTVHREYIAAIYAGLRAFTGTFSAFTFWILSRWPNGDSFVLIVGIICCLFATRPAPVAAGLKFTLGTTVTAAVALVLGFYVIPKEETFLGLASTLAPFMIVGAFALKSQWLAPYAVPMNFFLLPMIGVQNQMSYDPSGFFNSVGAIFCGCCAGVIIFTLLPPPSARVEAALLRWWIEHSAHQRTPVAPRQRDESRLRLYDRAGQALTRIPKAQRAETFERCRDIAVDLSKPRPAQQT